MSRADTASSQAEGSGPQASPDVSGQAAPQSLVVEGSRAVDAITAYPIAGLLALYLLATGRWGSYVTVPGASFYVGDIGVAMSALQVAIALAARRASLRTLARSPLVLLMVTALLAYATLRLAAGPDFSIVALRDAAPYAYAVVAVLAFLLPAHDGNRWRQLVYLALVFHLLWAVALRRLPGYPWDLPVLGADAQIFVLRPDFDATSLGVGAAFALHDLIARRRLLGRTQLAAVLVMIVASTAGMLAISTRAGLFAGLSALAATGLALLRRRPAPQNPRPRTRWLPRVSAALVAGAAVAALMSLTPAGGRLVDGFGSGEATGTISARQDVWFRVGDYVLARPERTAIGVGFGRDFIAESGSAAALEGIYQNVRSPHNYVVGTLARLGVGGALAVAVIIVSGWWLAGSVMRAEPDPPTVLASLLAISLPVVSLLGVVLESPFGAIPYFWAIGQLAAWTVAHREPVGGSSFEAPATAAGR